MVYKYNQNCQDQTCSDNCCNYMGHCPDYTAYSSYQNQCYYYYAEYADSCLNP